MITIAFVHQEQKNCNAYGIRVVADTPKEFETIDEDCIVPGYFKLKYDIAKQSLFALASPSWGVWHDFTGHIDDILSRVEHEYE